jgi:hypothetical protein
MGYSMKVNRASLRLKRLWKTPQWREKMAKVTAEARKRMWADPGFRVAQSARYRAGHAQSTYKHKKASAATKELKRKQSTEWWAKNKSTFLTPKRRKLLSDRGRKTHRDNPEIAVRRTTALKKAWADPKRGAELRAIAADKLRKQSSKRHPYTDRLGRKWNFRSGRKFELGIARRLDKLGLTWEYEPATLKLSSGKAYVPDFWVEEWKTFVEVKGWEIRVEKVDQAREDGHPVLLVRSLRDLQEYISSITASTT